MPSTAEYQAGRYEANCALIDSYMEECIDCGEDDFDVLEFDHVFGEPTRHPSGKRGSIRALAGSGSQDRIRKEVDLCEVRCANCHKKRHAEEVRYGSR